MGDPGYSQFVQLTGTVRNEAVANCVEMRENLWPNLPNDNCAVIAETSTIFQSDAGGKSDCTLWTNIDGETDGYDTDAPGAITCNSSRSCDIDQAFWASISKDPLGLHRDKTHGIFGSTGTKLRDVYPGSIAYELGLRTDDVITDIDGYPVTNLEDVEAAINALQSQTSWTVTVTRGRRTLSFTYWII